MKKIGILGGTFNPVHVEHVELAKSAKKELALDELIVMPTYVSPHKTSIPASAEDRLEMLRIAFDGEEGITVSDYEIQKQGKSYTYLTVEHFNDGNNKVFFICGGDMLTDFKNWRYPERILKAATLAVFGREDFFTDYSAEEKYFKETWNASFIRLSYTGKSASSTKIRTYAALSLPLKGIVPDGVEEYIREKKLYAPDKYESFILKTLPEKRVKHTADVVVAAMQKAKELNLDGEKVKIAATLHDCAKYLDYQKVEGFTLPDGVPAPVVHAFLGAYVAQNVLGVTDSEILDAIRFHTSGKAEMSTLGKLIFVADMVEEGRTYDGVEKLREIYEKADLDTCFTECLKEEFLHLLNKKQYIYQETVNAFLYYVK